MKQVCKRVGIVGLSGKPFHRAHEAIVQKASEENDEVFLIVSLTTRERKGEITITRESSVDIWSRYLVRTMPSNVKLIYTGGTALDDRREEVLETAKRELDQVVKEKEEIERQKIMEMRDGPKIDTPVGWTWWLLGIFSYVNVQHEFNVYVGPDDKDRFPIDKIAKYVNDPQNVHVIVVGDTRLFNVSGTQMRAFLAAGNYDEFTLNLPTKLSEKEKSEVWDLLKANLRPTK